MPSRPELFGSLGATGKGHGSDKAVLLGLEGEAPETADPDSVPEKLARIRDSGRLRLLGEREIGFQEKEHLILHRRKTLPYHPNGMRFFALDETGAELDARVYYSVGGGFVVNEEAAVADDPLKEDDTKLPYPFKTGVQMLKLCERHGLSISQLMLENEKVWRSEADIRQGLMAIWSVMQECVRRGCEHGGILPGGMKVRRRAPELYRKLSGNPGSGDARPAHRFGLGRFIRARRQRGKRRRWPRGDRADQWRSRHYSCRAALLRTLRPGFQRPRA